MDGDVPRETWPWSGPWRLLSIAGVVLVVVAGSVGSAFAPYLAVEAPSLLLALAPYGGPILLVVDRVGPIGLVVVALRRLFGLTAHYALGAVHGQAARAWVARRSPLGARMSGWTERAVARIGVPLLVVFPQPILALLVAVAHPPRDRDGWRARPLITAATALGIGQVVQLLALAWLAERARPLADAILGFFGEHTLETTLACTALVLGLGATQLHGRWRARRDRTRRGS